jgi:hypothetical protein
LTHEIPQFIQPAYAKPVDIVGYYKKQVRNQVEQDLYNVANENHNKINHGDYIESNFLLKYGQEDKYRNKLLKDRMQQLGLTSYDFKPSETSLTIGNDDEDVNKLDMLINDFVLKVKSGLFDISMLSELNEIFKIIQLKSYRFSNELLNKYLEYFDDMILILQEEETVNVLLSNSNKKLSKIGKVLLLLITLPNTCNCFNKYELDTINFIFGFF